MPANIFVAVVQNWLELILILNILSKAIPCLLWLQCSGLKLFLVVDIPNGLIGSEVVRRFIEFINVGGPLSFRAISHLTELCGDKQSALNSLSSWQCSAQWLSHAALHCTDHLLDVWAPEWATFWPHDIVCSVTDVFSSIARINYRS